MISILQRVNPHKAPGPDGLKRKVGRKQMSKGMCSPTGTNYHQSVPAVPELQLLPPSLEHRDILSSETGPPGSIPA